jgi:hypothetical protein
LPLEYNFPESGIVVSLNRRADLWEITESSHVAS